MRDRSFICGLILLTLWAASTSWAMPASYVYPTVSTNASFSPLLTDSQPRSSNTGAPSTSNASLDISHQLGSMVAESHGQVQPGLIRFFSSSTATAIFEEPPAFGSVLSTAQATITAGWTDTFTIDGGPLLNGTRGHLVAGFRVDGSFDWTVDPLAFTTVSPVMDQYYGSSLGLNSGVDSASIIGGQEHRISYPGVEQWGPAPGYGPERTPGLWTINLDFVFGTPILLQMQGHAHTAAVAQACPNNPCSLHTFVNSTANFSHTTYWAGLLGVTDVQGNSLSNYTVHSESGFNYRLAAVPIPAAGVLLATGLTALVGLAARRRS